MIYYWENQPTTIKTIVNYKVKSAGTIVDPFTIRGQHTKYLVLGAGLDTETTKVQVDEKFATAYLYHWQFTIGTDKLGRITVGGRSTDSFESFLAFLLSTINEGTTLLVFDANLGYEFQFLKNRFYKFQITDLFAKEKRSPLKFIVNNKLEMRECIGLFGVNLEKIAEAYSPVPKLKGDLDFDLARFSNTPLTEKEMQYCENDTLILSHLGEYVFNNFYGDNPTLPMTSTGIIRNKIKRKIGKRMKFVKEDIQHNLPSEELYNMFRNYLFKGGICGTNAFYMNRTLENVVCADYTSDYPACMNHFRFPSGECWAIPTDEFMSEPNIPYIATIEFHNLRSKTMHSLLSVHKALDFEFDPNVCTVDNNRIFRAKKITFIVNDIEFRAICKCYNFDIENTKILNAWRCTEYKKLPRYLLDVLNEEYLTKQSLKAQGLTDTIEYKSSKSVVNGTYGMTVTSIFNEEFFVDLLTNGSASIEPERNSNGTVKKKSFKEATQSMFLNPFWGFWITSYARSLLMDIISRYPDCIVQYDTDSIYYLQDHPQAHDLEKFIVDYNRKTEELNDILFDGNEHYRDLGCWEIGIPYKRFKGLGSKRYMYETADGKIKTVVAGARKGTIVNQYEYMKKSGKISEDTDIFDFFCDGMVIDKEHSKKLASKYIDKYPDGSPILLLTVKDYLGNEEEILCESAVVLEPIEFHMGLNPKHYFFYTALQSLYKNSPSGSPICKVFEELVYNGTD